MKKVVTFVACSVLLKSFACEMHAKQEKPFENYYGVISTGISKSMKVRGDFGGSNMGRSVITGLGVKTATDENIKFGLNLDYRPSYRVSYTENDGEHNVVSKDKYKIGALMIIADYEFNNFSKEISPYIQIGAGMSRVSSPEGVITNHGSIVATTSKKTKYQFAYSAGLGVKYKLNKDVAVGVGYKFSHFGKLDNNIAGTRSSLNAKHLRSNDLVASLEYKF